MTKTNTDKPEILAERRRCAALVLNLFAVYRGRDSEFAEALDRLANQIEHPDLDALESAAVVREWLPYKEPK